MNEDEQVEMLLAELAQPDAIDRLREGMKDHDSQASGQMSQPGHLTDNGTPEKWSPTSQYADPWEQFGTTVPGPPPPFREGDPGERDC